MTRIPVIFTALSLLLASSVGFGDEPKFPVKIFGDPRVIQVVEQGDREGHSVTADFSISGQDTDGLAIEGAVEIPKRQKDHNYFGVQADVGVPDGIGASAVFRPWKWLLLHFGVTTDGASAGIRGGITFVPIQYWISPSATIEGGHMFEGDANWIARKIAGDPSFDSATLRRVSYDYVNGQLGIELGIPNRFSIFIRAGMSYVHSEFKGFQQDLAKITNDPNITSKDPTFKYIGPSGKLGFLIYFW